MYQNLLIGFMVVISALLLRSIYMAWAQSKSSGYQRRKKHSGRTVHSYEQRHPYESVSCEGSCDALRLLKGRRFLVREAPRFPAPGCKESSCHCRYIHHHDRRTGGDRRGVHGVRPGLYEFVGSNERRGKRGRRRTDYTALA